MSPFNLFFISSAISETPLYPTSPAPSGIQCPDNVVIQAASQSQSPDNVIQTASQSQSPDNVVIQDAAAETTIQVVSETSVRQVSLSELINSVQSPVAMKKVGKASGFGKTIWQVH